MNRTKEQQMLINSIALEFGDFEPFNFAKAIEATKKHTWKGERILYSQAKFRDFLINEVINRVEKSYFTLNCSVGAMAFIERMSDYAWIEHGVGTLLLASCEIVVRIDFDLAGTTIMYPVIDPKSEQILTRVLIAE
jgi:hypothetical protein